MSDLPSPDDILDAHDEIEEAYDMKYTGTRVAAPRLEIKEMLEDVDKYDSVYERAACLLRRIITDHSLKMGTNGQLGLFRGNIYSDMILNQQ